MLYWTLWYSLSKFLVRVVCVAYIITKTSNCLSNYTCFATGQAGEELGQICQYSGCHGQNFATGNIYHRKSFKLSAKIDKLLFNLLDVLSCYMRKMVMRYEVSMSNEYVVLLGGRGNSSVY